MTGQSRANADNIMLMIGCLLLGLHFRSVMLAFGIWLVVLSLHRWAGER